MDAFVFRLREKHGNDWATIGAALGRSASSVKDRCRLMKDTCNTGASPCERCVLRLALPPAASLSPKVLWFLAKQANGVRRRRGVSPRSCTRWPACRQALQSQQAFPGQQLPIRFARAQRNNVGRSG